MIRTVRRHRWSLGLLAAVLLALAGVLAWGLAQLPSDAELATRVGAEFEQRLGIGLAVGRAHWALRPVPVVVLEDLRTAQEPPITVRRIAIQPDLRALWKRELAIKEVEVDGAVVPRAALRAFRGRSLANEGDASGASRWQLAPVPLARLHVTDASWIDRRGIALAYDGRIDFDPAWRPRQAEVARAGVTPPARLTLERAGDADRWRVAVEVGGGSWNGEATLDDGGADADAQLRLHARLQPRGVDITQLVHSFGRRSAVDGRINGSTEISARGATASELVRSLHTRTRFSVQSPKLLRFDLAKAVRTAGIERDGQTALDALTGTLDTQATDAGVQMSYSDLSARSGVLSLTGRARILNRKLDGELAIDLVDGVVGVPFKLAGTLDKPALSFSGSALAGAAAGSAVLPGVGTAIGARIGQRIGKWFGAGGDDAPSQPARRGKAGAGGPRAASR